MATWIAHLRIAETLLDHLPGSRLDAGQFAIGSIAPDSGIPDENWEKFNPPPEVTHFKRSASIHKDIADLDFYRGCLAGLLPEDTGPFSFRLGYFFHLVTDNLWTVKVGLPTHQRWADEFAADKKFIWTVKRDWYGLDFVYLRDHPESLFWRAFLDAKPDSVGLDFLPAEALSRQLAYIKEFYQRTDERVQEAYRREYIYLTQAEMDTFVDETAAYLEQVYTKLKKLESIPDEAQSILEVIPV
jgi:hypothetical protein